MNLANKIIELRTKRKLSQSDLAEKMGVSRQSVSKWETGASTPDLDKLILLSELFSITLDDLVKGEHTQCSTIANSPEPPTNQNNASEKTIGYILITVGLLGLLVSLILGLILSVPSALLIISGIFLVKFPKYALLKIGWLTFIVFGLIATPAMTSASMSLIFYRHAYADGLTAQLIVSYVIWFLFLILSWRTIRKPISKQAKRLTFCWCISAYLMQGIWSTLQIMIFHTDIKLPVISFIYTAIYLAFILSTIIFTIKYKRK